MLVHLLQNKEKLRLSSYGGPNGLANLLGSSSSKGLDPQASGSFSIISRQQMYGINKFKERRTKGLLVLVFEQLKDPTLILLMVAAAVSTHSSLEHETLSLTILCERRHPVPFQTIKSFKLGF